MLLWFFSFVFLGLGIRFLLGEGAGLAQFIGRSQELVALQKVVHLFHELQETLEAGLVPDPDRWDSLQKLPAPWGLLSSQSLQELRKQGGSLLPTLKRLRSLAVEHQTALKTARAKSAQALAQALVCTALVPLMGGALYFLLPGVSERPWSWLSACGVAVLIAAAGALWLLSMAQNARWGGLVPAKRSWVLASQCAGERFLALVRSGCPADLAWGQSCELLMLEAPGLAAAWGHSVWEGPPVHQNSSGAATAAVIVAAGSSLRKALQVSLMEGRPCTERVEAVLFALAQDVRAQVERELSLLGTRALKPLFICVAPPLMGLLVFGLFLGWKQALS